MKRLTAIAIGVALLTGAAGAAVGAGAALVKTGNLVLRADGGFEPRTLPRNSYVPIDFQGYASVKSVDGSVPVAVQQAVIDFDRDGRLSTAGLPHCDPARLREATPAQARSRCAKAIVGKGHVGATIGLAGVQLRVKSPLTIFNGPRQGGHPTAILHARIAVPAVQTFVITVPIERISGAFRYRATIDVPPIAGGLGSLTRIDVKIGRRYRFKGSKRSYVAARCRDNVLQTHGRFTFADGTIIYGDVFKGCTVRNR
jgi:hypothetical protein